MPFAAWIWALAAACCFAAALVVTQFGLRHLPPALGAVVSIPSSTLLFWGLAPGMLDTRAADFGAVMVFAAVGLLFPAVVTLLTFEANRRMGPNIAGALGNLSPVFAVAFAVLLLAERPGPSQLVALGAIVAGVSLLGWRPRGAPAPWPAWVLVVPLAAAAVRGLVQPAVKLGLALWPNAFAAALIGYTVSSLVVVGLAAARARGWPRGLNPKGAAWFAAVSLGNGVAVLSLYQALALAPVSTVAPVVAGYPLFTLALSAVFLRQLKLDRRQALAIAMTVAGVALLLAA